jgi:hypothetical protein
MSRAAGFADNPNHGLLLSKVADDFAGRINRAVQGNSNNAEDLADAHSHVEEARDAILDHQNAATGVEALGHLVRAGGHLAAAANAVPTHLKSMLDNDWRPAGGTTTPAWHVPAEENKQESKENVSLGDLNDTVNNTIKDYQNTLKDKKVVLPEKMQNIPEMSEETKLPVQKRSLKSAVNESSNRDAAALDAQRTAEAQRAARLDEFTAGTGAGR